MQWSHREKMPFNLITVAPNKRNLVNLLRFSETFLLRFLGILSFIPISVALQ